MCSALLHLLYCQFSDWLQSHFYRGAQSCVHGRRSVSTDLSRDFSQGAEFRSACCLTTDAFSLCQRKPSPQRPELICCRFRNLLLNTLGCFDCGKVLEPVTGTQVTMKQVVYRLALGNSPCEVSASCRAVLLWLLSLPTLLQQSHQGGRARPDVGES